MDYLDNQLGSENYWKNQGYGLLNFVRENLEVEKNYSSGDLKDAQEYLRRGDMILSEIDELSDDREDRKHYVEAVIDHYGMSANKIGNDEQWYWDRLQDAQSTIFAGIDQEIRIREDDGITAQKANELAENLPQP